MPVIEAGDAPRDISSTYFLPTGDYFDGNLTPAGDGDWVRVSVVAGNKYQLAVYGIGGSPIADPSAAVFNQHGLLIAFDNDSGPGSDPYLTFTAYETGNYFIAAASPDASATGGYRMEFDYAANETIDVPNSNQTPYMIDLGEMVMGRIGAFGDRDRYAAELVGGQTYRIYLDDHANALDPYLRIYNGAGTLVAQNDDDGPDDNSFVLFTPAATGTYYIEAADADDNTIEDYWLTLGDAYHEGDDAEPNNTTPYSMMAGQVFQGHIGEIGDRDWVAINMTAGVQYNLGLYGDNLWGELADPVISLYNSAGVLVGSNDDGGFGLDSLLVYTPGTSGTYYIQAAEFGNNNTGRYQIGVSTGPAGATSESDNLSGNIGPNSIYLHSGEDTYNAGAGNDWVDAGPHNDWINPGTGADTVDGGTGVDWIDYSAAGGRVFADLGIDQRGAGFLRFFDEGQADGDVYYNLENAMGSDYADNLRGNSYANHLMGGGVSDRLYGRAGDDSLEGGNGADALYGNTGADRMSGGADAGRTDRFIYFGNNESGVGAGHRDVITDFVANEDRIELGRLDADTTQGLNQMFNWIGTAGFSGTAGELRYGVAGGSTIVQADTNGDGAADFEIELLGTLNLSATDFLL